MDPLSIATAVLAASQAVGSVSQALYTFISSAKRVDDSVKDLHHEVQGLAAVLEAIDHALKQPIVTETREYTSLASGVWSSVNHAINDSQHTIKALGGILQGLGAADKASNSFRKVLKQIKLKFNASDISSVKGRIHTHTTSLQLALQMLSVFLGCLCSENALNVINPKLDDIGPKVGNLIAMVANLDISQPKPIETQLPDTFQNPEISGHTEELARSIKAVVTAASSVTGLKSSKWGGSESNFLYFSEYGELLDETWKTRMEQWIPPPMLEEGLDISMGVIASTEMSGLATPTEDESLQDDDSDDELDLEIVQSLIKSGGKSFAQQRYAEAVECYRAGIDRAKSLSQAKMSSLELEDVASKIASSEANIEFGLVQRVFDEAQQAFAKGDYCKAADMFRNGISRTRRLSLDRRSRLDLRGI